MELEVDVKSALDALIKPTEMDQVYKEYAVAFEALYGEEKKIVERALALLALSTGSISKNILLEALEVDTCTKGKGSKPATRANLREKPHTITQICKYLVELNAKQGVFRFCHSSAFEFFREYQPGQTHKLIAQVCLAYLSSPDFSQGHHPGAMWYKYGSLGPVLQKHPFLEFASYNWANSLKKSHHAIDTTQSDESDEEMLAYVDDFFGASGEKKNPQLAFQVYTLSLRNGTTGNISNGVPEGISHEHIISYLGLFNLLDLFAKREWLDLRKVDDEGLSSIHWAICRAAEPETETNVTDSEICAVAAKLIKYGVDVDAPDKHGRTALHYAAYHGHLQVVKLLVENKAKLNIKDQQNHTALINACQSHHEETISALVRAGADLWVQSSRGTALQVLCLVGCHKCVKLILDQDQIKDRFHKFHSLAARNTLTKSLLSQYYMRRFREGSGQFGTSLHAAAFHGRQEVVELLLKQGKFWVHATHHTYGSVLTAAAAGCNIIMNIEPYERIFKLLITHGVNVNNMKGTRGPALLAAVLNGQKSLVELLLKNGAKARSARGIQGTAYQAASDGGYEEIMRLLEKSDANVTTLPVKNGLENPSAGIFNVQQEFIKFSLIATNMENISSLISTGETFIYKEIEKGEPTATLSMMLTLGMGVFKETAELATNTGPNAKSRTMKKRFKVAKKIVGWTSRCHELLSRRDDMNASVSGASRSRAAAEPSALVGQHHTGGALGNLNEQSLNFNIMPPQKPAPLPATNNVDFAGMLDIMIQSAINILHKAIEVGNAKVKNQIAYSWVDVLHKIVTSSADGESLVKQLMNNRAIEYKRYWVDPKLTEEQRLDKVMTLSRVSVELLLVTFRNKETFKGLSLILSCLCSSAVNDVVDLKEQGNKAVRKFLQIAAKVFSEAAESKDRVEIRACADAGMELLKQAALNPKKDMIDPCADEWVRQWNQVIKDDMKDVIAGIVEIRLQEFRAALKEETYDEVLGLDIAALALLRAAIEQEFSGVIDELLPAVEMGFRSTMDTLRGFFTLNAPTVDQSLAQILGAEFSPERRHIYETVIESFFSLISMAERKSSDRLKPLSLEVAIAIQEIPEQVRQKVDEVILQHIRATKVGTDLQRREISLTIRYVLAVARSAKGVETGQFCSWVEGLAANCEWQWKETDAGDVAEAE